MSLLDRDPATYFVVVLSIVASIVLHELGHAFAADAQGDSTPRMLGHFTWNPLVHMGWLSLGLVALFGIGFGRTPVTPRNFRDRRWGSTKVSFAGPAVNLALWIVLGVALGVMTWLAPEDWRAFGVGDLSLAGVLTWIASLNLVLFGLNMTPVPPLDGFDVLRGFVNLGAAGEQLRRLGFLPILILFLVFSQIDVFGSAIEWTDHVRVGTVILLGGG